ncbi:general substrate transporter [Punctularia strigosozonata HHB-11173 SS5]|uniref:general substrate transporter n=1 Tax=Punctularia strigosozonata (strain HHB-11173) TaxID=741275 RepID=UPI0004417E3F|nr:general substrate transporter [Punctularia strigosozonata HHB-11173 SS5]EIN08295.1 general substrate transporter [Punctularia strigosozonata HHB-11173 SS5]
MAGGAVAAPQGNAHFAHLLHPERRWFNNRRLIILNAWIVLMLITSSTNGYDGSMMNGLQTLDQWTSYFNNPEGGTLGVFNAIQNIGSLAAYPFAPFVSDGIGRRRTIFLGAAIMCAATAIQTAAQSIGMFIGARFLIGFGLTFAANSAPMLVTELAYPPYRAQLTSLYNSLWYSGAIVAAWTTYGTFKINSSWSWRIPSALQGLPSVFQVILILFAPESPRWLVSKGREDEALKVLAYYHADGDETDGLVRYELEEIKAAIEFDRTVAANVGYKSLFTSPGNRKRMRIIIAIAFFSQWSGNGLVSYYLTKVFDTIGITSKTIQLLINGILQIWNLCWAVFASFMCDRAGRRALFLISTAGMFIGFLFQTVCSAQFAIHGTESAAHAVIAFIFIFYAFYDLAFTPLIVSYTVEILPFPIRAKGFNVFNFVISLALIFNQYVNPIALKHLAWKYYIVYVVWIVFEFFFCYFFIVETKNRTLEETAALFDGDQAAAHIVGHARSGTCGASSFHAETHGRPQSLYVSIG